HVPGRLPGQVRLVDQVAHQLGDGQGRVRVVELHRRQLGEALQAVAVVMMALDEVADGAGNQEVFLNQPQLPAGRHRVGGVEDLADGLREYFSLDGLEIVTGVKPSISSSWADRAAYRRR